MILWKELPPTIAQQYGSWKAPSPNFLMGGKDFAPGFSPNTQATMFDVIKQHESMNTQQSIKPVMSREPLRMPTKADRMAHVIARMPQIERISLPPQEPRREKITIPRMKVFQPFEPSVSRQSPESVTSTVNLPRKTSVEPMPPADLGHTDRIPSHIDVPGSRKMPVIEGLQPLDTAPVKERIVVPAHQYDGMVDRVDAQGNPVTRSTVQIPQRSRPETFSSVPSTVDNGTNKETVTMPRVENVSGIEAVVPREAHPTSTERVLAPEAESRAQIEMTQPKTEVSQKEKVDKPSAETMSSLPEAEPVTQNGAPVQERVSVPPSAQRENTTPIQLPKSSPQSATVFVPEARTVDILPQAAPKGGRSDQMSVVPINSTVDSISQISRIRTARDAMGRITERIPGKKKKKKQTEDEPEKTDA